jgi:uncharacterized membrane protein
MRIALGAIIILAVLVLFAHPASAQGCAIATEYGPLPDYDCDGVPDNVDNCPGVNNADQADMNRNGIGDFCDALIEEIHVSPDNHLRQGEIAHITVRIINNHPETLKDITISVRNSELNIDAQQTISLVPRGEQAAVDFWLKIPRCAATKTYNLAVSATTSEGQVETESESMTVDKNTVCGQPAGALDYTIINVFNQVDIDQGGNALIPIAITNLGDNQATYDMSVADLGNFGTWRIDPAARLTLQAGHKDTAYLYLQTEPGTRAGSRDVVLTVTSDKQTTKIPIHVYVRSYRSATPPIFSIFQIIFIIFLLLLIAAAIIVAVKHRPKSRIVQSRDEKVVKSKKTVAVENADTKIETYY